MWWHTTVLFKERCIQGKSGFRIFIFSYNHVLFLCCSLLMNAFSLSGSGGDSGKKTPCSSQSWLRRRSAALVWAHDSPQLFYEPIFLNALRLFLNICIMSFVFIKPSQITSSFPWCLTCFFYILWPWKQFLFSFHSLLCIMIIEACELLEFNFST